MGTFGDALRKGAFDGAMSYSGRFRYRSEFGKGLIVYRSDIPVYEFDGSPGGTQPINLYSGKDNSIVIALEQARQLKRLSLYMPGPTGMSTDQSWTDFSDILNELYRIRELAKHFFLSFAVQKNSQGKKIELLVLQDDAAYLKEVATGSGIHGRIRFDFTLKTPKVKPVSLDRL